MQETRCIFVKKLFSAVIALTMLISAMNVNVFASNIEFSDTAGHWAENAINKWADKGIISGYPDETFKLDNPVTRAELAKILALAFDLPNNEFVFKTGDIDENAWYYEYLPRSAKYIPVYALPDVIEENQPYLDNSKVNAFLQDNNAIRMHVAEALVEIKKEKEMIATKLPTIQEIIVSVNNTFKDTCYENLYAGHGTVPTNVQRMFEYTYLANELGIMHGDDEGYFKPYGYVTRAELITMIDRIISTED